MAFSESLRQEITRRHVHVSAVEPRAVATELAGHIQEEVRQQTLQQLAGIEPLAVEDIAAAIGYMVTRPSRVAVKRSLDPPDRGFVTQRQKVKAADQHQG